MKEALSLTPDQWEFFQSDRGEVLERVRAYRASMDGIRSQLWKVLATDKPGQAEIDAALSEVLAVQSKVQHSVVEHLIRLRASLDEKQQALFDGMLNELRGCPMQPQCGSNDVTR